MSFFFVCCCTFHSHRRIVNKEHKSYPRLKLSSTLHFCQLMCIKIDAICLSIALLCPPTSKRQYYFLYLYLTACTNVHFKDDICSVIYCNYISSIMFFSHHRNLRKKMNYINLTKSHSNLVL